MQQQIARPAEQPRPVQQEIAHPLPQSQAYIPSSQWPQSYQHLQPVQQSYARPAQPPVTRTMPQPQRPIALPVQQPQQSAWRAPQSTYAVAHPVPRRAETVARPLPQQPSLQTMMRELPQPSPTFARPMSQPRPIANPALQRSAPQVAYNAQPRAPIQVAANRVSERDAGRGAPNHEIKPAQERDHR
jgi:hypothetical protein